MGLRILEVVTEHTGPIRTLIEVLKDMLTETNIEFRAESINKTNKKNKTNTKKKNINDDEDNEEHSDEDNEDNEDNDDNENNDDDDNYEEEDEEDSNKKGEKESMKIKDRDGMRIMAVDTTKTVLINLKLDAKNFTKFVCRKNKLSLGVNLSYFYKLIKSMNKNDILTLYVDNDDKNNLKIKIDSPEEKKDSVIKLKLLDLDESKISLPDIMFEAVITMNSQEFSKLCKEMNNIADYVEIKCLSDKIIFTCKGDYAEKTTTYRSGDVNNSDEILVSIKHASTNTDKKNDSQSNLAPQIVQGIFELKNLVLFSKCATLCNDIEIYMKNNYPLVIKYTVATLGRVILCLTPINENAAKNSNYSDEDEHYDDDN